MTFKYGYCRRYKTYFQLNVATTKINLPDQFLRLHLAFLLVPFTSKSHYLSIRGEFQTSSIEIAHFEQLIASLIKNLCNAVFLLYRSFVQILVIHPRYQIQEMIG